VVYSSINIGRKNKSLGHINCKNHLHGPKSFCNNEAELELG
jgi:hypothetical protein